MSLKSRLVVDVNVINLVLGPMLGDDFPQTLNFVSPFNMAQSKLGRRLGVYLWSSKLQIHFLHAVWNISVNKQTNR
jgi:hypothetical protein